MAGEEKCTQFDECALCDARNQFLAHVFGVGGGEGWGINKQPIGSRVVQPLGICLNGSVIDSDLACPQFRGNE